jgi:hypothetical protein
LSQPHVLFISPSFFGYEEDIVGEFTRRGYQVTFLDERPSNSPLMRAFARVAKSIIHRKIARYYRSALRNLWSTPFSLVIVIKGEVVPSWFLQELRARNLNARFVFYTFDSLGNASNCLSILHLFDRRLTFDINDASSRRDFEYLPLFYAPRFRPPDGAVAQRTYRASFIGTLHSDRYRFVTNTLRSAPRTFAFFYVQARWYFFIVKYITRSQRRVPWSAVSFTTLNNGRVAEIFRNSEIVIDMQRDGQAGLTMRTFEVLASGAALVTTNKAIEDEPFYDPDRILVVDLEFTSAEEVAVAMSYLSAPSTPPPGFNEYSLTRWVDRIVSAS